MKKVRYTKKGNRLTFIIMAWLFINFFTMFGLAMKYGTCAFTGGQKDEKGYFAFGHGKRYDFDKIGYHISYWQGMVTSVSFALGVLVAGPIIHFKCRVKEEE